MIEESTLIDTIEDCILMDWSTLVPTLVGAGISVITTVCVLRYNQRQEQKRREDERDYIAAMHAYSGHHKLLAAVNLLHNIKVSIDRGYDETKKAGINSDEPWHRVPASIGSFSVPDFMTANELIFLQTKEGGPTIALAALVVERARNTQALFDEYGSHRTTLQKWVQGEPRITAEFDGVLSKETIPAELRSRFEVAGAQLNQILGAILEKLDADIVSAEEVAQSYMDAARAVFGEKFPEMKVESVEAKNADF